MSKLENALKELLDAVQAEHHGLEKIDIERGVDDNMALTGVSERVVKAFLLGRQALEDGSGEVSARREER